MIKTTVKRRLYRFATKLVFSAGACLLFLVAGCGSKEESTTAETPDQQQEQNSNASGNPLTAPVDYLGAVGAAQKQAGKTLSLVSIQQAIQQFQTIEGRNPATLSEVVSKGYLVKVPTAPRGMRVNYDPRTGQVTTVRQ